MKKLIMLRGLPASGKSTEAQRYIDSGNYVRVNKDLLRTMLHFDKWNCKNESITAFSEYSLIRALLKNGNNVIVDNTNLTSRHEQGYRSIADETGASFEIIKMNTPFDECVKRDEIREKKVGQGVILKFALQTGEYPAPQKGFVICDIDGTIANIEHRRHYVTNGKKDWRGFFSEMDKDSVREEVHDMLKSYSTEGYEILFVSARPETYRAITEKWLRDNIDISYAGVVMRPSNDKGPDTDTKLKMYETMLKNYTIHKVIDDRPSVIKMWRSLGLDVIDVGDGIDF